MSKPNELLEEFYSSSLKRKSKSFISSKDLRGKIEACFIGGISRENLKLIQINNISDTTLVVHFWATWCKPCIEELPNYEKLSQEFAKKKIKFLMVSMDFPKDLKSKVLILSAN